MMGEGGRELRKWLAGLPGLEPGDLILIRVLHSGLLPCIGPATWANDVPQETVVNRWAPMACGPNVDQARLGCGGRRSASGPWLARQTPAGCPRQASRPATALLRELWRVGARDIPLYRRSVPGHRHGGIRTSLLSLVGVSAEFGGLGWQQPEPKGVGHVAATRSPQEVFNHHVHGTRVA